jgi:RNA-directed DNA polymerase
MFETRTTTVPITKEMVKAAYRKVASNKGAAGVDKESLEYFRVNLLENLYVIWNRLSSGSYFPKPVRAVSIPKVNGKRRVLGIPTVSTSSAGTTYRRNAAEQSAVGFLWGKLYQL